ncbi:MAG: cytochrome D1 domain-containing protein, partial [Pirellulales bacterium]
MSRVLLICMLIALAPSVARAADEFLHEEGAIALPGVVGRFDHFSVDFKHKRLFVAALGNDTLEVLDLAHGKVVKQLPGLKEPQGVAFVAETERIWVANGESATIHVFDAKTFELAGTISTRDDPDNLRYDAAAKCVYVGYGRGDGAIGVCDAATLKKTGDIAVGGHPESFKIEPKCNRNF